jgi:hypothetical protein
MLMSRISQAYRDPRICASRSVVSSRPTTIRIEERSHVRQTGRFEHCYRAMSQTVKRNLAGLARLRPASFSCLMSTRRDKSSIRQNLPELIGECAGARGACGTCKNEGIGIPAPASMPRLGSAENGHLTSIRQVRLIRRRRRLTSGASSMSLGFRRLHSRSRLYATLGFGEQAGAFVPRFGSIAGEGLYNQKTASGSRFLGKMT